MTVEARIFQCGLAIVGSGTTGNLSLVHVTGMGVSRWSKALGDLQGLGCSLSRANLEALFRSAVHAPVSQFVLGASALSAEVTATATL